MITGWLAGVGLMKFGGVVGGSLPPPSIPAAININE
jgi:hypothetical protein